MLDREPPIHGDRATLLRDDPAAHDYAAGDCPAAGYDEFSVAGLRESAAVKINEPLGEIVAELPPLRRAGGAPMGAEHKSADAFQIEILPNHLDEVVGFVG